MSETMNSTISRAGDAIIELVSTSVAGASFDTTIRAIVQDKVDSATGKYKLQYQDSVMYAFVDDVKTTYSKGTEVYVLIPKNDFTSDKRIIGSVKTLGEDYTLVLTEEDKYKKIGASAFGESNGEHLTTNPLYEYDNEEEEYTGSLVQYYDPNFLTYLRNENTEAIWLEGTFETEIEYDVNKKYSLEVAFQVNTGTEYKEVTASINQNNIVGNPFCLRESQQIAVFDFKGDGTESIDWSKITKINSVKLTTTEFDPSDYIKVTNIKLYAVSALTQEQLNAPYAYIFTPNGTIVAEPDLDKDKPPKTVTLKGILRINQQVQTDVKYFWFIEDLTVNKDSGGNKYHDYGGRGWRLLNRAEGPKDDGTYVVKDTDEKKYTVLSSDMKVPVQRYKCVIAKDKDSRYSDIVEITSKEARYGYMIQQKVGADRKEIDNKNAYLEEDENIVLVVCDSKGPVSTDNLQWFQKKLFESEWTEIEPDLDADEQKLNQLTIRYEEINVSTQIRAIVNGFNTETITITAKAEIPDPTPQYQLVIENADQTFIYDEDGRSPTHPAKTFRDNEPKTLSFKLYDTYAAGTDESPYDITNKVSNPVWKINADGLVSLKSSDWDWLEKDEQIDENKAKKYQLTAPQCNFLIKDAWSYNTTDNQITLTVEYQADSSNPATKATITAKTNFTFLKEGDPGTNGTGVAIVVEKKTVNNKDEWIVTKYVGSNPGTELTTGVNIDEITYIKDNKQVNTGVYKAKVTEGNAPNQKVYYGYYVPPMVIPNLLKDTYRIVGTPSQYVVYNADGTNPRYSDWKFEKYDVVKDKDGNPIQDEQENVKKEWQPVEVTFGDEDSLRAVIPSTFNSNLAASEGVFQVTVKDGDTPITTITLLASLNRHAFSMINGWDGNLTIDNGNNWILSATVAAGKKDDNNTFTGILIGSLSNNDTGLFGYNAGVQTAFISATDGSVAFGPSTAPLIQIGKGVGKEFIQSSNYSTKELIQYKLIDEDNTTHYVDKDNVTVSKDNVTGKLISITYKGKAYTEGSFKEIYSRKQGMRIDLDDGNIYAPGYSIINGDATFSGTVYATNGSFSGTVYAQSGTFYDDVLIGSTTGSQKKVSDVLSDLATAIEDLKKKIETVTLTNEGKLTTKIGDTTSDAQAITALPLASISWSNSGTVGPYNGSDGTNSTAGVGFQDSSQNFVAAVSNSGAKIGKADGTYSFYVDSDGCHAKLPSTNLTLTQVTI